MSTSPSSAGSPSGRSRSPSPEPAAVSARGGAPVDAGGDTSSRAAASGSWLSSARTLASRTLYTAGVTIAAFGVARSGQFGLDSALDSFWENTFKGGYFEGILSLVHDHSFYFKDGTVVRAIEQFIVDRVVHPADDIKAPLSKVVFGISLILLGGVASMSGNQVKAVARFIGTAASHMSYATGLGSLVALVNAYAYDSMGLGAKVVFGLPGEIASFVVNKLNVGDVVDSLEAHFPEGAEDYAGPVLGLLLCVALFATGAGLRRAAA